MHPIRIRYQAVGLLGEASASCTGNPVSAVARLPSPERVRRNRRRSTPFWNPAIVNKTRTGGRNGTNLQLGHVPKSVVPRENEDRIASLGKQAERVADATVAVHQLNVLQNGRIFYEHVESAKQRERVLSCMLMTYTSTVLEFMLLPGTFLGVWNLLSISGKHGSTSVSPAWIQARGQAQTFGWIGPFILGIGFYSIPKMRRLQSKPPQSEPSWTEYLRD